MDRERARELLMAHMDGEITDEEHRELEAAMTASPELRRELARWEDLGRQLAGFRLKDPADEVLEAIEHSIMAQTGLHVGWFFAGGAALLLFGLAVVSVLLDPRLSLFFRASAGGLLLGLALLFAVKVKERLLERQHDPYRHVIR